MSPTHSNRSGGMKHRDDPQSSVDTLTQRRSANRRDEDEPRPDPSGHERTSPQIGTDRKSNPSLAQSDRNNDRHGTRLSAGDRDDQGHGRR